MFNGASKMSSIIVNREKQQRSRNRAQVERRAQKLFREHLREYKKKIRAGKRLNGRSIGEDRVCRILESNGYTIYRRGWPDICAVKGSEIRFIEVKQYSGTTSPPPPAYERKQITKYQKQIHSIFSLIGFPVEVVYESNDEYQAALPGFEQNSVKI